MAEIGLEFDLIDEGGSQGKKLFMISQVELLVSHHCPVDFFELSYALMIGIESKFNF